MQLQLLKAMFNKDSYVKYNELLHKDQLDEMNKQAYACLNILHDYYKENEASPTLEMVKSYHKDVVLKNVSANGAQLTDAQCLYEMLEGVELDESVEFYAKRSKLSNDIHAVGSKLVNMMNNPDADEVVEVLQNSIKAIQTEEKAQEQGYLPSVDDFCKTLENVHKWEMPFQPLNERTQGFGPSRSMLLFALSNVGKSSVALAMAYGFMQQGARVLDLSITEDPFSRRMPRLMQAIYDVPYLEIEQNKADYYQRFLDEYGDMYAFVYDAGMTMAAIRKHVEAFKPDIVIVDNFTKIQRKSKQDVNHAKSIGLNLAELKGLAEEYQFGVIPVCQAADSANGKTVLTMRDIADSKVDVPAELEIAVGIAAGQASNGMLYFNLAKNKLGPEEQFAMAFNAATCQFSEV